MNDPNVTPPRFSSSGSPNWSPSSSLDSPFNFLSSFLSPSRSPLRLSELQTPKIDITGTLNNIRHQFLENFDSSLDEINEKTTFYILREKVQQEKQLNKNNKSKNILSNVKISKIFELYQKKGGKCKDIRSNMENIFRKTDVDFAELTVFEMSDILSLSNNSFKNKYNLNGKEIENDYIYYIIISQNPTEI